MKRFTFTLILAILLGILSGAAPAGAVEDKSVIKIGSDIVVAEGQRVRHAVALGGQITVSGAVDRHVVAVGGSVVLTKTATVGGNVIALGGVIVAARDAQVGGSLTEINSSNLYELLTSALSEEWEGWSWIFAVISIAIFIVLMVLSLLIVALLPKPVRAVADVIEENTFKVILWGLLGLVLIVPLALLLTVSVVGIALIPLEVIVVASAVLLGFIAVGQWIGRKIYRLRKRPNPGLIRETFWGLIILWIIGWLPYLGWMVKAIAIVVGLGASLVSCFGTRSCGKPPAPPAPVGEPESPPAPPPAAA